MAQEDRQREPVMPTAGDTTDNLRDEGFLPFIRLFAAIDDHPKLFPKECRVCGRTFGGLPEYLHKTIPKAHVLEDCREVMGRPFTMMYRHCPCGNTLILTFTEEILPALDEFWGMLRREAERAGLPLRQVVGEFSGQCDRYIISRLWSSLGSTEKDPVVEIA